MNVHPDVDPRCYSGVSVLRGLERSLRIRAGAFGRAPLCNLRPKRAFSWGRFVLPLCARCSGLVVGGLFCGTLFLVGMPPCVPVWCVALAAICLVSDWSVQRFWEVESNNVRRFVTGLLFGFAVAPHGLTV